MNWVKWWNSSKVDFGLIIKLMHFSSAEVAYGGVIEETKSMRVNVTQSSDFDN